MMNYARRHVYRMTFVEYNPFRARVSISIYDNGSCARRVPVRFLAAARHTCSGRHMELFLGNGRGRTGYIISTAGTHKTRDETEKL